MKKQLLVPLFYSLITLNACVAQNLSKSIENSLNEKLYLKVSGNLYVKQSSANSLLILCKTSGTTNGFDKAFVLFSETTIPKLDLNLNDEYEIQIPDSKKFAVLYNVTKNKIHFIGTSDKLNDINNIKKNSSISGAVSNMDYLSYGFSYLTGSWSIPRIKASTYKQPFNTLDYSKTINPTITPMVDDPVSCAQNICTSGGAGSSSCSITEPFNLGCTVTCNAGYYACCVSSTTRCYCCKIIAN